MTAYRACSTTLLLDDVQPSRAFYETHFAARAVFDSPNYVALQLGDADGAMVCLMNVGDKPIPAFQGGITINLEVHDVDALHERLSQSGLNFGLPLDDHPWGDRAFGVIEPSGAEIYCFEQKAAPTGEYAGAVKQPWQS